MHKKIRKGFLQSLRVLFVFAFILSWEFSAWPSLFSFPPKVPEAKAQAVPISYVQSNAGSSSGCTSCTVSFSSNTATGNLIFVGAHFNTSPAVLSVTDTLGNVYTQAGSSLAGVVGGGSDGIFYANNIKGGPDTVSLNFASSQNTIIYISEYAGLDKLAPLDVSASSTASSLVLNSGSATTTYPLELIVGFGICSNTCGPGASFTTRNTFNGNILEDKVVSTIGSYSATGTQDIVGSWGMQMATFKGVEIGVQASNRSDTLNDSRPSVTSNHSIAFTINSAVVGAACSTPPCASSASSTLSLTFPS